ncbi:endothelin-converting enzyme 1-like isoform X2 [Rhipicephalus microplus]|uniref:endothelin-converting enzyme 1-like isoform X2 n=1 Tax=Rhipicephalus microplus TaxID=6941 RepID=UPI003F6A7124
MYHACISYTSSYEPETKYLVRWMVSLNLDLLNETRLMNVNPVEMMVRGSLDFGVEAILSIVLEEKQFEDGKRVVTVERSNKLDKWRSHNRDIEEYYPFVTMYGAKPPLDKQLALKIQRYENRLQAIEVTTITPFEDLTYTPFEKLGESTKPYVTANEWITFFYKYTNGTYTEYDSVMSRPYAIAIIVKLFKSMSVGLKGLRYLVAWTFYRQLVEVTDQYYFLRGKPASDVCYQHVKDVMNLAILTHYFHTEPYPNVPLDRYFPTWIKAFSHSAHYFWIDKATPLYREDEVNAYYTPEEETLTVPTGIMCGPVLYPFVPLAINYGGLGMVIGHEFMRAFDLNNIKISYWTEDFRKDYTEKALCLRRSHKSVLTTTQQNVLDDIVDSENIADFVGTRTAYEAFASLPEKYKSVKLVGFNMTSDQLFFINHCVKWCAEHDIIGKLYERFRSRCIVPLRNMPEFSEAFGCSEETRMNPPRKCNFW